MRLVAGGAPVPLRPRRVSLPPRLSLFPVAFKAEPVPLPCLEIRVRRSMGIVAGEAFPAPERGVENRPPRLQLGFVVALGGEGPALLRCSEGRLGGGGGGGGGDAFFRPGVGGG